MVKPHGTRIEQNKRQKVKHGATSRQNQKVASKIKDDQSKEKDRIAKLKSEKIKADKLMKELKPGKLRKTTGEAILELGADILDNHKEIKKKKNELKKLMNASIKKSEIVGPDIKNVPPWAAGAELYLALVIMVLAKLGRDADDAKKK